MCKPWAALPLCQPCASTGGTCSCCHYTSCLTVGDSRLSVCSDHVSNHHCYAVIMHLTDDRRSLVCSVVYLTMCGLGLLVSCKYSWSQCCLSMLRCPSGLLMFNAIIRPETGKNSVKWLRRVSESSQNMLQYEHFLSHHHVIVLFLPRCVPRSVNFSVRAVISDRIYRNARKRS